MGKGLPAGHRLPQRTCVACGDTRGKRELVRLVRTAEGMVEVDPTGKRAGRGAYLCPRPECWRKGLKGKGLDHRLRTSLNPEQRQRLEQFAATLSQGR
ncbi:MAG: YlxR family protein [Chloroflexota bacterium]